MTQVFVTMELYQAAQTRIAEQEVKINELEKRVSKLKKRDVANSKANKGAPRNIVVNTSTHHKKGVTGFVSKSFSARIVKPSKITSAIRDCLYVRGDIVEAKDRRIAELEAALTKAANGYENLVEMNILPLDYQEAATNFSREYHAIAKGEAPK